MGYPTPTQPQPCDYTRRSVIGVAAAVPLASAAAPVGAKPRPRTLLEIAGAPERRMDRARAALVVIDHQREYVDGGVPLDGVERAVDEIAHLMRWARVHAVPVVHVFHHGAPGARLFAPGSRGAQPILQIAPVDGEQMVIKRLPNGFAGTDLDGRLKRAGRDQLVLTGFATHMCLDATTRAALDLGYQSFVVASATADRDLPDPLGGVVPAAAIKRAVLTGLADRFATVLPTTDALLHLS